MTARPQSIPLSTSEPVDDDPVRRREAGQALVIMVLAMVALIAGMGLIIDGGNAWAQQRITQAGNDAAAEAGALVLASQIADPRRAGGWDASGRRGDPRRPPPTASPSAIAYYTDICGTLLRPDGTKAAGIGGRAPSVGGGTLPTNNHTNPDCPSGMVGPVAGVQASAPRRRFDTYVSRVMGITTLHVEHDRHRGHRASSRTCGPHRAASCCRSRRPSPS